MGRREVGVGGTWAAGSVSPVRSLQMTLNPNRKRSIPRVGFRAQSRGVSRLEGESPTGRHSPLLVLDRQTQSRGPDNSDTSGEGRVSSPHVSLSGTKNVQREGVCVKERTGPCSDT